MCMCTRIMCLCLCVYKCVKIWFVVACHIKEHTGERERDSKRERERDKERKGQRERETNAQNFMTRDKK